MWQSMYYLHYWTLKHSTCGAAPRAKGGRYIVSCIATLVDLNGPFSTAELLLTSPASLGCSHIQLKYYHNWLSLFFKNFQLSLYHSSPSPPPPPFTVFFNFFIFSTFNHLCFSSSFVLLLPFYNSHIRKTISQTLRFYWTNKLLLN